ncbi:RHS repeat-associated core domain-containing protein [Hamadaea tsunoensis]|uniref:RHS repeat-associated core domain-containing protein n=1 Tax=Hamadaea tsunoensis TaxID=53368 RepID=UPI00068723D2|nr:RHS repeat-associated core domain-containing protein [Hamadaea tsunoensis]
MIIAASATLLAGLLVAPPPAAAAQAPYRPAPVQREKPVPGTRVRPVAAAATGGKWTPPAPVWPAAASADLDLRAAATDAEEHRLGARAEYTAQAVRAGTAPVWVSGTAGKVRVSTFDHATAVKAGAQALLMRVDGTSPQATVVADYSAYQWAYGGGWAQRLRFVELPDCALSTPDLPQCQGHAVATSNNAATRTATATVTPRAGALMALSAGPSGDSGSYSATPLASSGTWTAGGNSGDFSWSYPMRSPPALGGPTPGVALSYSSSSVDGRMAASNNQPSWIGEGFELDAGYIERKYRNCSEDMTGGNNATKTGDLCWATDNASLAMSGHAGELLVDGSGTWHLRAEDGTRVERRTGAANGARNGEYWVATTPDGTQYWFGNNAATTLNVTVAGNQTGEPCHAAAFADSFCAQAWRWNLDHVVDTHGNTMTYVYTKETGKYARNLKDTDVVSYDRAAYLNRIDYGTRTDRSEAAPMQVVFDTADRCLADCGTHDAAHWPDVPWDQDCTGSPCRNYSPTFWTTKRLAKVTMKTGGKDVESWTLTHSFPNPGDGTRAGLWLDRISHTGLNGTATAMPDVTFTGVQLNNRVDTTTDGYTAMNWWRIKDVNTEYGGRIEVTYSDRDCVAGSRMPDAGNLAANHLRCYPVKWVPDGKTAPILDYFHKYVVKVVTETDLTNSSPSRTITQYDYVGDPAWHYTDDDGIVGADYKTWSVWRGYGAVRATKGDPGEQSVSEERYFRGMGGTLPAAGGAPAATDEEAYAGMTRESITYNGTAEVSGVVSEPWQSAATATRTVNGSTVTARYAAVAGTRTRTALDGGRGNRTTSSFTTFDGYGLPTTVDDHGDDQVTGDEKCTLTDYARNTSLNLLTPVSRVRGFAVGCAKANAGGLTDDDVAADDRTYYDGQALGAAPTKGDVTKQEGLKAYNAGSPTYLVKAISEYDSYGRSVKVTDLKGATTTQYTPAAGGPVTQTLTRNPLGWATTTTLDPAWGLPLVTVDANGRRTELAYDGLGRTTAVWLPGRDRSGNQTPNMTFDYLARNNAATVVTTRKLNAAGGYTVSYQLYDGLLRPRQTQSLDPSGAGANAVVTDAYYDSAGRSSRTNDPYISAYAPGTDLIRSTTVVPSQTVTVYDGAGRATASVFVRSAPPGGSPGGTEMWRTTTAYGGDRTDVTPPQGGIVSSTIVDAEGKTVELRQYHTGVAAGGSDPAGFDATRYAYDRKGQLVGITDAGGARWTYAYDLHGRQTKVVDPDKGTVLTTYSDAGEALTTTDGRGQVLVNEYDALGRKTAVRSGSATGPLLTTWVYDTLALGQLTKSTRYVGGDAYTKENLGLTVDYKPTTVRYTIPEAGVAGTYDYTTTYNQDGSKYTDREPAIGDLKTETLKSGYDAFGQATTLRSAYGVSAETDLVTATGYTQLGELGNYTLRNNNGNSVGVTRTYDPVTRRLGQIWAAKQTAPTTLSDVRYTYDDFGGVTRIADLNTADVQCFQSDHLRRMTEAWAPTSGDCTQAPTTAAGYWTSYRYDAAGDRTKLVQHSALGDTTTDYTPTAGRHTLASTSTVAGGSTTTAAYTYDGAGNQLTRPSAGGQQTLTWDAEGHLATTSDASGPSSFVYDADGERLIRRDPTGTTLYLPGQELRFASGTGAKTGTRYYSQAGQVIGFRVGAGLSWIIADQHGTAETSVTAVTQAVATRKTMPFGEARGGTGTWSAQMDKGFVGGTRDNTGLVHLGAREYDPSTGRFISADPVIDTSDPQQMHGYAYGNNNPVTYLDADGRWSLGGALKKVGGAIAKAAVTVGKTVGNAAVSTFNEIRKDPLKFATGLVVGALVTLAVGAVCATGVGCVILAAAAAGAAAAGSEYGVDVAQGEKEFSIGELGKEMAVGGAVGALTAGVGTAGGKVLRNARNALRRGDGLADDVTDEAAGVARQAPGCHSFDPATLVLMADGTTKPIGTVALGDAVLATDPVTGQTRAEKVTTLHENQDWDLTDLDLVAAGRTETLHTTWTHPFWDVTAGAWVNAAELKAGHRLRTADGSTVTVAAVRNRIGSHAMRDLTVDGAHTYYVVTMAGPVLVHNNPAEICPIHPDGDGTVLVDSNGMLPDSRCICRPVFRLPRSRELDEAETISGKLDSVEPSNKVVTRQTRWDATRSGVGTIVQHHPNVIDATGGAILLAGVTAATIANLVRRAAANLARWRNSLD